jgi:predicted homoserine dehydrogenase-like protein
MVYTNLLARCSLSPPVTVGILGAGNYGTAIITQSPVIPQYQVTFVGDVNLEAARTACRLAGWGDDRIAIAESEAAVRRARSQGKVVLSADPALIAAADVEVVVEASGNAAAGAEAALAAFAAGRHVVMVNKETDSVVGPLLGRRARAAGVVYTQADGDQPALLIALWEWAKLLGLDVIAAGKSHDVELVVDRPAGLVRAGSRTLPLRPEWAQATLPASRGMGQTIALRRASFGDVIAAANYDRLEMVCIANGTDLNPLTGPHSEPILRTTEIPDALCLEADGGVAPAPNSLETICTLLEPGIPTMGGGVFVVVRCANDYSRQILMTKGLIPNRAGTAALIYRPYHLCGVETPISILAAGRLGVPTGARETRARWDCVAVARRDLPAGTVIDANLERTEQLASRYATAAAAKAGGLLPLAMCAGLRLAAPVSAGADLTRAAADPPSASLLWRLRAEQDAAFPDEVDAARSDARRRTDREDTP